MFYEENENLTPKYVPLYSMKDDNYYQGIFDYYNYTKEYILPKTIISRKLSNLILNETMFMISSHLAEIVFENELCSSGNFLDLDNELNQITFVPNGKLKYFDSYDELWESDKRKKYQQIIKVGKLFKNYITEEEINRLCSVFINIENDYEFKIVDKQDITFYYNADRYDHNVRELTSSCMSYEFCSKFFSLYEENAKLLILKKKDEELIIGRALLWETTNGLNIMDRIYAKTNIQEIFKRWAKNNNYYCKKYQNNGNSEIPWISPYGEYKYMDNLKINVKTENHSRFPYLDSFSVLVRKEDGSGLYLSPYNENYETRDVRYLRTTVGLHDYYEVYCEYCGRYLGTANSFDGDYDEDNDCFRCYNCDDKYAGEEERDL